MGRMEGDGETCIRFAVPSSPVMPRGVFTEEGLILVPGELQGGQRSGPDALRLRVFG